MINKTRVKKRKHVQWVGLDKFDPLPSWSANYYSYTYTRPTVFLCYPFHWQKIHKFAWITEQALVWYRVDKAAVVARQPNEPRPQSRSLQRVAQDAAQMQPRERMQLHQLTHGTLLSGVAKGGPSRARPDQSFVVPYQMMLNYLPLNTCTYR